LTTVEKETGRQKLKREKNGKSVNYLRKKEKQEEEGEGEYEEDEGEEENK